MIADMAVSKNCTRVEAPTPDRDPIENLQGAIIMTMLELNFDMAVTNTAMTQVLVLMLK